MENNAKVTLSVSELAMATDRQAILTKQSIIQKAGALFSEHIPFLTKLCKEVVQQDETLLAAVPKITKGENYNGYPYVIMDYPASFDKENIFALRTMFWWGNFISITLHLTGKYKLMYGQRVLRNLSTEPELFVCIGKDEWQHHFEINNFTLAVNLNADEKVNLRERKFIKVAVKYELHHWNMMQTILPEGYKKIIKLLRD